MIRSTIPNISGESFHLFGTVHLIALGLLLLTIISFPIIRTCWGDRSRNILRYALMAWIVFWEGAYHVWNIVNGTWNIQEHLPLHICSLAAWLSVYMLAGKNYSVYEVVYFVGIGGASQAMFTPDTGTEISDYFRIVQTFASHSGIILAALYMTLVEGYRPTVRSLVRVVVLANIYLVFIFFLNFPLGSNYLFIAYKPTTFYSLLDYLAPWPWYIFELEAIGLAVFGLLYLPFLVHDLRVKLQAGAKPSS